MRSSTRCGALMLTTALVSCGATPSQQGPEERQGSGSEHPFPPNRLARESSPYLLLHAHNPVDWYPWGEDAIEKSRREDKPIFLSIGYSTCYWCHVMEREVFSDPEIAKLMNQWFVNVKVDREERPDLDEIYMTATQLLTGSGGWPNSVFLTPDLKPFFAGTYFPPQDGPGRPGFPRVLRSLHEAWTARRSQILETTERLAGAMEDLIAERREPASQVPPRETAMKAVDGLASQYDEANGGFGGAPKFPSPGNLFLLWHRAEEGDHKAREMVVETLLKMGRGAIYDQLGGGFHRYTLDARWRVPHFEKMLYDNAHLAELLSLTAAATGDPELERLARGTLDFVLAEMTHPGGGFKSAIDAETGGEEGAYYVWSEQELRESVGPEGFDFLAPLLGFDGEPNFEGNRYTLYLPEPLEKQAKRLGLTREALLAKMTPHLERLREGRRKRKFPLVDDKVLADWNGMMVAAMARAGSLLGDPRYVEAGANAARFVLDKLSGEGGRLLHAWREGEAKIPAFVDDYAFMTRGLVALHDATGEGRWLEEAKRLAEEMDSRLVDRRGGYFLSEAKPHLLFQPKAVTDGALPSGNAIAILNLLELADRTGDHAYRQRAAAGLRAFASDLERQPSAVPTLALGVLRYHGERRVALPNQRGNSVKNLQPVDQLAQEVVKAEARFTGPAGDDGFRPFRLGLHIREGWHVNAHPASLEYLIPTRVEGKTRRIQYPKGELHRFDFAQEILAVYSGSVSIRGEVNREERSLRLVYQACDDRRCLPPVEKAVALPVEK